MLVRPKPIWTRTWNSVCQWQYCFQFKISSVPISIAIQIIYKSNRIVHQTEQYTRTSFWCTNCIWMWTAKGMRSLRDLWIPNQLMLLHNFYREKQGVHVSRKGIKTFKSYLTSSKMNMKPWKDLDLLWLGHLRSKFWTKNAVWYGKYYKNITIMANRDTLLWSPAMIKTYFGMDIYPLRYAHETQYGTDNINETSVITNCEALSLLRPKPIWTWTSTH